MKALGRFRYRTAVAMVQGDHIVPFASAAINPTLPALTLDKGRHWRWSLSHAGFTDTFGGILEAKFSQETPLDFAAVPLQV